MPKTPSISITGIGVITPLGVGLNNLWMRLLQGETAVQPHFDLKEDGYRCTLACRINTIETSDLRRGSYLILQAAKEAVRQANIQLPPSTGVFIGSTLGESAAFEAAAEGKLIDVKDYNVFSFVRSLQKEYNLSGSMQALSTACTAGNYAVGTAAAALRRGSCDIAIAGGVEPFSKIAMVGFSRSRAMASEICKPFDGARDGMILGEGAAIFVLERTEDALNRGAIPLAQVHALGLSCDAYHPTAPHPDGRGLAKAMLSALEQSSVEASEIGWINIHGSGTRLSDAAEGLALKSVFKERMPILSGSKGALGHSLGASSAIELAISVKGLAHHIIPPTVGHTKPDPEIGLSCTTTPVNKDIRFALNCASAFGGLNAALLIESAN